MPRPEVKTITFSLDGREVEAPEGMMLVDAANKFGDVEIPVFCYEPKLVQPVGACRMCLVEIEGIPKLQTGCSTPVKDGMVVHTQTQRVHEAQQAVVEFLLINHPLDCPVCDQILGNCLCVLGDAMAMPIASMIKHFRPEFEEHIEAARERAEAALTAESGDRDEPALTV